MRDAVVVDFRGEKQEQIYIHFIEEDKRLDTWVARSSLEPAKSIVPPQRKRSKSVPSRKKHVKKVEEEEEEEDWETVFSEIHRQVTIMRNIDKITINHQSLRPWYYSPYPYPYGWRSELFICDRCLDYFLTRKALESHIKDYAEMRPPGREIYREGNISIFELSGIEQKYQCQCLCLFAKLFIDRKTLHFDTMTFVFYMLCECDQTGAHVAAYFSKELKSDQNNILSCICAFPMYQRRGYGRLLISLSYEIAKRQNRFGGPERPFSKLGKTAYHAYWRDVVITCLNENKGSSITIKKLVQASKILEDDLIEVVNEMDWLKYDARRKLVKYSENDVRVQVRNPDYKKRMSQLIKPELLYWYKGDDTIDDISDEYMCP